MSNLTVPPRIADEIDLYFKGAGVVSTEEILAAFKNGKTPQEAASNKLDLLLDIAGSGRITKFLKGHEMVVLSEFNPYLPPTETGEEYCLKLKLEGQLPALFLCRMKDGETEKIVPSSFLGWNIEALILFAFSSMDLIFGEMVMSVKKCRRSLPYEEIFAQI